MKLNAKIVLLFLILVAGVTYSFFGGGILGAVTGAAGGAEVSDEVLHEFKEGKEEVSVIVILKDEPANNQEEKKEMIRKTQDDVLKNLEEKDDNKTKTGLKKVVSNILNQDGHDIDLDHKYSTINGFSGEVTKQGLNKLKKDPGVEMVYFNKIFHLALDESVPRINADKVWNLEVKGEKITGRSETICVIDTGIDYTHPALGGCSAASFLNGSCSKVLGGYDFVNDDNDPMDDNGHGTHVSGIAAGNHSTYTGVAKDAKIVSIKVCGSGGSCEAADLIAGIEWCANNATRYNISVISMSLGDNSKNNVYCNEDPIAPSINSAVWGGLSVVIAAGNSGYTDGISSPACVQNATPSGAVNSADNVVFNRGEILDLLAPGTSITAPYNNGGTKTFSGTSMSTPHIAGSFALFRHYWRWAYNLTPTPQQIEDKFRVAGAAIDDTSNSGRNYSLIDVYAALQPFINFTATSVPDNSLLAVGSATINATSDVDISNAFLELSYSNGSVSNITMNQAAPTNFHHALYNIPEGQHTYKIYGNDSADFFGVSATRTLIIDVSTPKINITSPFNNTKLNRALQPFNATVHESNTASIIFNFDNSTGKDFNLTPTNNSGNWHLNLDTSSLADGSHVMRVIATDLVGNVNDTERVHFIVDLVSPQVDFHYPRDGSNFTISSGNMIFNASVNDSFSSISSVLFVFDNSSGTDFNVTAVYSNYSNTWSAAYNVSSLVEGLHTAAVFAEDESGNVNDSISIKFIVDNTAPLATIISPVSGSIFSSSSSDKVFNASVNDSLSMVSSVLFIFDNSSGTSFNITGVYSSFSNTWSAIYDVSLLMDGLHLVTVAAEDFLGNVNRSMPSNFTIDKTNPSVTLTSPGDGFKSSNQTIMFNCSAEDNIGLSNLTLYGNWSGWHANETKPLTGMSGSTSFVKTLPDGNYLWNCMATDTELYTGLSSQNRSLFIDFGKPLITGVGYSSLTENSINISWMTDEDSNSSLAYGASLGLGSMSSSALSVLSHSIHLSGLSPSTTYYYNLTSCDSFANCATSGPYNFTTNSSVSEDNSSGGNEDNSSNPESDSGSDSEGSDPSSSQPSSSSGGGGGGGGGGGSGGEGSSSKNIAAEEQPEPELQQKQEETETSEETSEQQVEEKEDELEQELSAAESLGGGEIDPESGFGSLITGLFSALIPSDSKAGMYVVSFIGGLALLISIVSLLIHRRGRKDEFAADEDDGEENEIDISYHERLP